MTYTRNQKYNKLFIEIVNLINEGTSPDVIWPVKKSTKVDWQSVISLAMERQGYLYDKVWEHIMKNLNISVRKSTNDYKNTITDETLEAASKIFIYLTAPPQMFWIKVLDGYSLWCNELSLSRTLGISLIKLEQELVDCVKIKNNHY